MSTRDVIALCSAAVLLLSCGRRDVVAEAARPRDALPPPAEEELALPEPVALEIALPPPTAVLPPLTGSPLPGRDGYAPQTVDRVAILSLAHARRFGELNRAIEEALAAAERDYHREYWPADAFDAFDSADPRLDPLLDDWVRAFPASALPLVARGTHRAADAWYYRGDRSAEETPLERSDSFERRLGPAVEDLHEALRLRPGLLPALRTLLQASRTGLLEPEPLLEESLRICPDCFLPRAAFLETLLPRWGGSIEKMEAFAKSSASASPNPRLALLSGFVPWYQSLVAPRSGDHASALALADRALSHGDYWEFHFQRACVWSAMPNYEEALRSLDRAIELRPGIARLLEDRAALAASFGRYEPAAHDLILALRLAPAAVRPGRVPPVFHGLVLESRNAAARSDAASEARLLALARLLEPAMNQAREGRTGADSPLLAENEEFELPDAARRTESSR